jgi:nucleoside-diphosphate-sugar epimerase
MIVGITGGTGFIGKKLALRHIENGDAVRILTRRAGYNSGSGGNIIYFEGDLSKSPASELIKFVDGVDILYHCAGEIRDQEKMHAVNITGTKNLCESAHGKIGRLVHLSSVGVYGYHPDGVITEETPLAPSNIYERSKAESDKFVLGASNEGAFSLSTLRPSNVYGPDMSNQSLYQMISMIKRGCFFFIGSPGAVMNYIHVDNVVEGLMMCGRMSEAEKKVYNLSDFRTIEGFAAVIAESLEKPTPKLHVPIKIARYLAKLFENYAYFPLTESRINSLTGRAVYSIEKIRDELGYSHKVSMDDGLSMLIESMK